MKNVFVILSLKKLLITLFTLFAVICIFGTLVFFRFFLSPSQQMMLRLDTDPSSQLQKENARMKGILSSFVPDENMILYENDIRTVMGWSPVPKSTTFKTYPLQEVLGKGRELKFNVLLDDPNYFRPIYDPAWKDFYFRSWVYLPYKNINARHSLFIFPLGASAAFDFEGDLAFDKQIPIDAHRNINFLIYNFNVTSIKAYNNQMAISGEPTRTGVQVISIIQDTILPENVDTRDFLIHLSTPQGYALDYIYSNVIRYDYLMKTIEENTVTTSTLEGNQTENLEKLLEKNELLKKEVAYYIPMEDTLLTQQNCRRAFSALLSDQTDSKTMVEKGKKINFSTNYQNKRYQRPIYDPDWKLNYQAGWSYLPEQICLNLHKLFTIPENAQNRIKLFGMLGFKESSPPIQDNTRSFLVYNFSVNKIVVYSNHILLLGEPSKAGVQLLSIPKNSLLANNSYLVRLITPDLQEIDYDTLQ